MGGMLHGKIFINGIEGKRKKRSGCSN